MLLLLAIGALASECWVVEPEDVQDKPWGDPSVYGVVDHDDLVIVRIPEPEPLQFGFHTTVLHDVVRAALSDRVSSYDFVTVLHPSALPDVFDDAAAFHITLNQPVQGLGTEACTTDVPARGAMWMNYVDYWDPWGPALTDWVFAHELGHHWLSFADVDPPMMLGRQGAHWSYFLDTPNSPMEGNAWIDNGDGSFTTDRSAERLFSPLDLYLLGLATPDDVPPFFVIDEPYGATRGPASSPEHRFGEEDVTVWGTRVDLTVDDVISATGTREPGLEADPNYRVLMVLLLGPNDPVTEHQLDALAGYRERWTEAWSRFTGGRSTVDFTLTSEGFELPPAPQAPALIPDGAQ